ncbi:MAG: efflux RND transporter periplasmic adaptor subunit [Gammaproteobacteria bacterium]
MPRRHDQLTIAATACAVSLLTGCGGSEPQGPATMFGSGPVAVIVTEVAAQSYVDRFTALGTARANESIEVTSRISSVVTGIHFEEGQQVEARALLVELDNAEIRADLTRAEASLKQKNSQFKRSQTLGTTRVVSDAELEELEAGVLMAEADVRAARARLSNSMIRAPFAGTVGLRRISLGDLVGPDTLITTLDDTDTIKLEFTIPETFLASLETGMPIEAHSNVYTDRRFVGEVSTIDPRIDPVTRALTVIAKLPNDDNAVRPGMFLTVAVEKERDNVLLIPEEALVPRQGRQFVFVIQDGKAVERQVELGARAPGLAEVRSGLAAGDTIVTEGTQKVRNGAAVQVVTAS